MDSNEPVTDKSALAGIVFMSMLESGVLLHRSGSTDSLEELAEIIAEAIIASGWPVRS